MSEEYKQFARETYEKVYNEMKKSLELSGDTPLLVMSGEHHFDSYKEKNYYNAIAPDSWQEPAAAAAYTHIAMIQAAIDLVGKENVVVSVEMDAFLEKFFEADRAYFNSEMEKFQNGASLDSLSQENRTKMEQGAARAQYFAKNTGVEIVGTDLENRNPDEQLRKDAEIEAIGKIALRTQNTPKIVLHIGGADHIPSLQGHKQKEIEEDASALTKDPDKNPFLGIFGDTLFFNSGRAAWFGDGGQRSAADGYYTNPDNAVQIDAPGAMDESDIREIEQRIQDAAREMRNQNPAPGREQTNEVNPAAAQEYNR